MPGGQASQRVRRWHEQQRAKLRGLYEDRIASAIGCSRNDYEREADQISDLYFNAFYSHADPGRYLWRKLSLRGTSLNAGYLSYEWRIIVWNTLKQYQGKCFKVAMVATFDSSRGFFDRHWVSVTFGDRARSFGPSTAALDPWLSAKPEIFADGEHERGNWLGTHLDEVIGPGGKFLDEQGSPVGNEVGPVR